MAQTAHLTLKANGTQIEGDSSITSMDRENTIEVLEINHEISSPRDDSTGRAAGRRVHSPFLFTKRVDRSSVLIYKAMTLNEVIEAEFRFYRPAPTGDGTTEQFYTIVLTEGRIVQVKLNLPGVLNADTARLPETEQVGIAYANIRWTWEDGGIEHEDDWMQRR